MRMFFIVQSRVGLHNDCIHEIHLVIVSV